MLLEQQAAQIENLPWMMQEANRLNAQGQSQQARELAERIVRLDPSQDDAMNLLGLQAAQAGQGETAVTWFAKAAAANPANPNHLGNLAGMLISLGRLEPALEHLERAVVMSPSAEVHNNMGAVLQKMDRLQEAAHHYRQAVQLSPASVAMWNNLGFVLLGLDQLEEADSALARALALAPQNPDVMLNVGALRVRQGKLSEGKGALLQLLQLAPDSHSVQGAAHVNLANMPQGSGNDASAIYHLRQGLALSSGEFRVDVASALLFNLVQRASSSAAELFQEHVQFSETFETPLLDEHRPHANSRDPNRRIRVALVSADLRSHSVAFFLEPLLPSLAALPGLDLHAYSNTEEADAVTDRIRPHFAHWTDVHKLTDDELAQRVRTDGIDILIDMSGHTAGHRLLTFARKPAPVQASWMGYPGTTGLSSIDYYLADRYFLPPGQLDSQFSEKIVQLPASVCFRPHEKALDIRALPALANGYLTFGSFNHLRKVNHNMVAVWSKLLRAVPDARLLLGGMPADESLTGLRSWFAEEGIDPARLIFQQVCPVDEYLALHHLVDIHLDSFPYNGGTTTWHALTMGVPSITLAGETPANRSGASILGQVGLAEFVAASEEQYVEIGVRWAGQIDTLAALREGMKERFVQSAPNRPSLVAHWVEQALRTMWKNWCSGSAPQSFVIEPDLPSN